MTYSVAYGGDWVPATPGWYISWFDPNAGPDETGVRFYDPIAGWVTDIETGQAKPLVSAGYSLEVWDVPGEGVIVGPQPSEKTRLQFERDVW